MSKLFNLKQFHQEMKSANFSAATFNFSYNEINCACLFNANYEEGFSLTFFKKISGESLKITVKTGYLMDDFMKAPLYPQFCQFFNIKRGNGKFLPKEFWSFLDSQIPSHFDLLKNIDRPTVSKILNTEEKDRPYFKDFRNWKVINAKNPKIEKHRSDKNLEKTRLLYPDIYLAVKDEDISILYTDKDSGHYNDYQKLLRDRRNGN